MPNLNRANARTLPSARIAAARGGAKPAHHLNEAATPVSEDLFGRLAQAEPRDAVAIARELPLESRARLAGFCYSRRHLNHLGLLIASTCDKMALRRAMGTAGDVVFSQSRDVEKTLSAATDQDRASKISLAKNVVSLRPVRSASAAEMADAQADAEADFG